MEQRRNPRSRRSVLKYGGSLGLLSIAGCVDRAQELNPREDNEPQSNGSDDTDDRSDGQSDDQSDDQPDEQNEWLEPWDPPVGQHDPLGEEAASFEALEWWSADGDVELSADSDHAHYGDQSALVEGNSGAIWLEFSTPRDLSDHDISFAMDIERPESAIVHLALVDIDNNRTSFRSQYHGGVHPEGFLRFAPSITSIDADMSQIAAIRIALQADDEQVRYRVDDLRFHEQRFDKAKFVFTFDDIARSQYETAYPIMDEYGFVGSLGVNTNIIGNSGRLTLEQLSRLDEAGWALDNHTHTHANLRGLSEEEQREEIEAPIDFLVDYGFDEPSAFYYTYGHADKTTLDVVAEHHDIAYNAFTHWSTGLSPSTPMSPYWTNRMLPRSSGPVEHRIDLAIEANAVCSPYWHTIRDGGEIEPDEFEAICEYLDERSDEIDVVLPEELAFDG